MKRRINTTIWTIALGCPVLPLIAGGLCGCGRDVRLSGRNVPTVAVKPVNLYGQTLDQAASPEQVVYAALQAIREDFRAAGPTERDAALMKQFDLCAANVLKGKNRSSLSGDEFVFNVVYRWTPTVSHYLSSFPADWESARAKLARREVKAVEKAKGADLAPDLEEAEVAFEADDPSGDPRARVVIVAWLAKDKDLWRIMHFGFDRSRRALASKTAGG